ncbi:MAG: hypothetical protein HXX09_04940 [Bacteroidetes bacterium]|nr:hypothetical protein [Bacteroidota bacterium]
MKTITKTIIWITIFSIAMGFLETAVVVYIRALYYPAGFAFPMVIIDKNIMVTELFREAATIIMLVVAGIIAGRKPLEKFAFFIYSFAIWDIFYYVFLKMILNWPESFMTWDVLFFIPITWIGPVLAPIINSVTMIILALLIIYFTENKENPKLNFSEWSLLIIGSLVVIVSFTYEYAIFMMGTFSFGQILDAFNNPEVLKYATKFIPSNFKWLVFSTGVGMHLISISLFYFRQIKLKSANKSF